MKGKVKVEMSNSKIDKWSGKGKGRDVLSEEIYLLNRPIFKRFFIFIRPMIKESSNALTGVRFLLLSN